VLHARPDVSRRFAGVLGAQLLASIGSLARHGIDLETGHPSGIINLIGLAGLFLFVAGNLAFKVLTYVLDQAVFLARVVLLSRSDAAAAGKLEPPKTDNRFKFFLVLAFVALACPLSIAAITGQ
jgi:hypothetical protein